jgi:hypothetical protein
LPSLSVGLDVIPGTFSGSGTASSESQQLQQASSAAASLSCKDTGKDSSIIFSAPPIVFEWNEFEER